MSNVLRASDHERSILAQDYFIMGILDKGAFAQVKVALHLNTRTLVAIKILEKGKNKKSQVVSEIDLMRSLYHRHIIQLLQVIECSHKTFLVMELAGKGSLQKYINKYGHLDEGEAQTIFLELCLAIDYIHSQNIAHRDIKAENVLLDWEGHVKLADFGLSKRLESGEKSNGFCGTAQYSAPEVFLHTPYDAIVSDMWSLGVLLHYLVIGFLPFREKGFSKIKYEILSWSGCIPYYLSPDLHNALKRLMTKDPTKRPSIKEILAHPWLCHNQDSLSCSYEIPRQPEPNIAFSMYLMGCNIQELRNALRKRIYNQVMATYLLIKKKPGSQLQLYHDGGQGGSPDPAQPARRLTSAPNRPTFSLHTLSDGGGGKGYKRRHSMPPSISTLKSSFQKNTLPLQKLVPHCGKGAFREKEDSIDNTTSPSRRGKATAARTTTSSSTTTKTSLGTSWSLFTPSQTPTFENTADVANESSKSTDKSGRTLSCGSTIRSPFPSKKIKEENPGTEYLQDITSDSREADHQEQLQRQHQGVPRVPLRRLGWKGLKKTIFKALRSLCCCLPVTNSKIMAVNEECRRDSG
ncbi:sperm motility kinase X-like [Rattus rattus]|uniref:sperm motility kinase X-like n=1 Tax=Rattus rattus TaxID=10117 RepID=UPI0013F30AA3|nr:sperm motility kinase X-like [Rattus rattus]